LWNRLEDVALGGTPEDVPSIPAPLVRSFVGKVGLRETTEGIASAGLIVAKDSGLAHLAGAVAAPGPLLLRPPPPASREPLAPGSRALRSGLPCEPCWYAERLHACAGQVDCLRGLSVDHVERHIRLMVGHQDSVRLQKQ